MAVAKTDLEIKLLTALKRIAAYQPPDQATCEAIRALNHQGECWAKVADQK